MTADIVFEPAAPTIEHDVDPAIILDELGQLVPELLFMAVLTGGEVERKYALPSHQIDRGARELERQGPCRFS